MLGEKRSRAAFQGDSLESVRIGGASVGKPAAENTGTGNKRAEKPVPPSTGEAYLDSLLNGCLGRAEAGCPDSAEKAMGDDRGTTSAITDERGQIRRDAGNPAEITHRPAVDMH